mgnify:CR=1 FL=1
MNHSNCILENGDLKGLNYLETGEKVKVYHKGEVKLSEMKLYLSKDENEKKIFTKIYLDNEKNIVLSNNHYILSIDKFINVSDLDTGSKLLYMNDKNEFEICEISKTEDLIESGCYFILTEKGNIIIDNMVISSFSKEWNILNLENIHSKLNFLTLALRKFPSNYIICVGDSLNKFRISIRNSTTRIRDWTRKFW